MSRTRTLWEEGHTPGSGVVVVTVVVALAAVLLDLALLGRVSVIFDLVFVLLCVTGALLVHPRDFFVVGVLPPLLMLGIFLTLSLTHRSAIADPADGMVQAVVSGLSRHSVALGLGYALCLAVLGLRQRWNAGPERGFRRSGTDPRPRNAPAPGSPRTSRRPWWVQQGSRPPR